MKSAACLLLLLVSLQPVSAEPPPAEQVTLLLADPQGAWPGVWPAGRAALCLQSNTRGTRCLARSDMSWQVAAEPSPGGPFALTLTTDGPSGTGAWNALAATAAGPEQGAIAATADILRQMGVTPPAFSGHLGMTEWLRRAIALNRGPQASIADQLTFVARCVQVFRLNPNNQSFQEICAPAGDFCNSNPALKRIYRLTSSPEIRLNGVGFSSNNTLPIYIVEPVVTDKGATAFWVGQAPCDAGQPPKEIDYSNAVSEYVAQRESYVRALVLDSLNDVLFQQSMVALAQTDDAVRAVIKQEALRLAVEDTDFRKSFTREALLAAIRDDQTLRDELAKLLATPPKGAAK